MAKLKDQKQAIENQDEGQVLKIIEDKNVLIESFKKLENEIKAQLQLLSKKEIEGLLKEGSVLKDDLESILKAIVFLEEECEGKISSKMREVEKRILGLQKGKKIGEGYGRHSKVGPLISKII